MQPIFLRMGNIPSNSRPPTATEAAAFYAAESERATPVSADQPETLVLLQRLWTALDVGRSNMKPLPGADPAPFAPCSPLWKNVGFQNANPLSDVRGGGALSLQLLAQWAEADDGCAAAMCRRQCARSMEGDISMRRYFPLATAGISLTVLLLRLFKQGDGGSTRAGAQARSDRNSAPQDALEQLPLLPAAAHWPLMLELSPLFNLVLDALEAAFVDRGATYMEFPMVQQAVLGALEQLMPEAVAKVDTAQQGMAEDGRPYTRSLAQLAQASSLPSLPPYHCMRKPCESTLARRKRREGDRVCALAYAPVVRTENDENDVGIPAHKDGINTPGACRSDELIAPPDHKDEEGCQPPPPRTVHPDCHSAARFSAAEAGDLATSVAWLEGRGTGTAAPVVGQQQQQHRHHHVDDRDARAHWTQLHFAARFGHADIVEALLGPAGGSADANALCPSGMTALEWAVHYGHEAVVAKLLEWALCANSAGSQPRLAHTENALLLAAAAGHVQIVKLLVALASFDGHGRREHVLAAATERAKAYDQQGALTALRMGPKERNALRHDARWQRRRAFVLARECSRAAAPTPPAGERQLQQRLAGSTDNDWLLGARLPEYAYRMAVSFL